MKRFFNRQRRLGLIAGVVAAVILFSGFAMTPMLQGTLARTPVVDGLHAYVGYGINVLTARYPNSDNLARSGNWLNVTNDAQFANLISRRGNINSRVATSTYEESDSLSEVLDSKSFEMGVDVKVSAFSAGVSAKMTKSEHRTTTVRYAVSTINVNLSSFDLRTPDAATLLRNNNILPAVLADINSNLDPRLLFSRHGTHMISSHTVGGKVRLNFTYTGTQSVSSSDFSGTISAGNSIVKGTAGTTLTNEQRNTLNNTNMNVSAFGGDGTSVVGANTVEQARDGLGAWRNSLNAQSADLNGINDAIPIWEFAANANRRNALRNEFTRWASEVNTSLEGFSRAGVAVVHNEVYVIHNQHAPGVMDVQGNSKKKGAWILVHPRHGRNNQRWRAEASTANPGWFYFRNIHSGKYLDVKGGHPDAWMIQWDKNGSTAQRFRFEHTGGEYFRIISWVEERRGYTIGTDVSGNARWARHRTVRDNTSTWRFERVS